MTKSKRIALIARAAKRVNARHRVLANRIQKMAAIDSRPSGGVSAADEIAFVRYDLGWG